MGILGLELSGICGGLGLGGYLGTLGLELSSTGGGWGGEGGEEEEEKGDEEKSNNPNLKGGEIHGNC